MEAGGIERDWRRHTNDNWARNEDGAGGGLKHLCGGGVSTFSRVALVFRYWADLPCIAGK